MPRFTAPGWLARWATHYQDGPGLPSMIFGVVLPACAIVFELMTRMCAEALFDPMPTLFHLAVVALVPALNLFAWASFTSDKPRPRLLRFANGVAIGIAAFYSVLFLPVLPIAAIGIIVYGLGLLPWAPPLSLIAAISLRLHLRRAAVEEGQKYATWPGVLCGLLMLIVIDLPVTLTQLGTRMAISSDGAERASGLRLLRAVGDEKLLLRLCYVRTGRATDMISFVANLRPIDSEQARKVYYRVTGMPFNARPAPKELSRPGRWWIDNDFDSNQGTDTVGGQLQGLALASSRIDGSIDARGALGYLEWTMVLRNDAEFVREGRAQIALPPGAVVSRLTLWVNGEEREAAFAARGQVAAAYRAVVQQRRDPVLITTAGADRISMQMFPVPVHGEMKIRIGMTLPLRLTRLREGSMQLPYFHERNFDVPPELRHSVWLESKAPLENRLGTSRRAETGYSLQQQLADNQLSIDDSIIRVPRDAAEVSWSADFSAPTHIIKQTVQFIPELPPSRAVIVVDASTSMATVAPRIADAIASFPSRVPVYLIMADDDMNSDTPVAPIQPQAAAATLRSYSFTGGYDNSVALARGLDLTMMKPDGALVWIHGPQPVLLQTGEAVEQRLLRGRKDIHWYDVQVTPGRNLIGEGLTDRRSIETLRFAELDQLFARWRINGTRVRAVRERLEVAIDLGGEARTSTHLARLWANDEVTRLLHRPLPARDAAIDVASHYQLVTPVTGAVVLETQQQYDASGLSPVPEGTVPTIPEPEEWALLLVALLVMLYAYKRRHEYSTHATL